MRRGGNFLTEVSPTFIIFKSSPKTNAYRKTSNQPVILSGVELSPSEERGESARPLGRCGISLGLSVACLLKVTFTVESHPNSFGDPANRKRFALSPRSSLGESSTSLRMTYSGFVRQYASIIIYRRAGACSRRFVVVKIQPMVEKY